MKCGRGFPLYTTVSSFSCQKAVFCKCYTYLHSIIWDNWEYFQSCLHIFVVIQVKDQLKETCFPLST